ncbi:hypothetical protein [Nocardia sp. NPDC052112]|uniref:hypothetical protein n=1 Tax=Nocardia sp. NPDC052112 TaxID=3155646 RepID=UPI0034251AD9
MPSDLDPSRSRETTPSVRALLAQFHEETLQKLAIAPTDSDPIYQAADGSLSRVEDSWISDSDAEIDKADAATIQPTSGRAVPRAGESAGDQTGRGRYG